MIGETLGQCYRLVRFLGKGGMGAVYAAEHQETRERVAVKVLHGHLLEAGDEGPRRFRREAKAAGAIRGEHVARVLEVGTDEQSGQLYLVTEYLEGEDLERLVARVGPLAPEAALRIAFQALLGLCEAHDRGIVHRDIKPANIFLARGNDGEICVKLLDFGIAKICNDALGLSQSAKLTQTGSFLGSPLYMSPEQVQNSRDVDHRTDLWSLGSVLYALLAGRAPFEHLASLGQLFVAICVSAPPPLADVAPWVPAEIAGVVHRALTIVPDARYASARAMLEAIGKLLPSGTLREEMLVPSGEQAREVVASTMPPSPLVPMPNVVVPLDPTREVRGDEATEFVVRERRYSVSSETLPSGMAPESEERLIARSAVPAVGAKAGGRFVTVDPRRIVGEKSELWTFSLDVHRHVSSLVARIWKSMRRAGAKVPPMTYGSAWVLFEPRTGRTIVELGEGLERLSLEEAGIRPGMMLWVVEPEREDQHA